MSDFSGTHCPACPRMGRLDFSILSISERSNLLALFQASALGFRIEPPLPYMRPQEGRGFVYCHRSRSALGRTTPHLRVFPSRHKPSVLGTSLTVPSHPNACPGPRTVTDDDADSDLGTTGTFDDVSSFLPPFANAENRALDLEIREKERLLEQLEGDTEDTEDRVDAMKRHLRNVEDEVRNTQSRAQARRREKETEAHMKRLSELAVARVRDDAKKMEKEELELDERVTNIETSTHFGIEKLDRYKLQLNWGQEELEQWSAASVQKDEDALALQRYQRADEARVRELNVAIEKVTAEVSKKKELLDREGTALGLSQIPASLFAHTILTLSFIYLSQRNARRAVGT